MATMKNVFIQRKQDGALCPLRVTSRHFSLSQRVGADLQARIKGEFGALHQILHDEESCVLEQLRKEQQEELEKVQRHLEAAELATRELEDNMRALQQASAAAENVVPTEVRSRLKVAVKLVTW